MLTQNKPFTDIPKEDWNHLDIDWNPIFILNGSTITGFGNDNFPIQAYEIFQGKRAKYKDLHVTVSNIHKWLKVAKKEFGGRREHQEVEHRNRFKEYENY